MQLRSELRQRSSQGSVHSGALLSDNAGVHSDTYESTVKNMLPPKWVDHVESVERDLEEIDKRVEHLKELHRKRLMVSFSDDNEQAQEREIEDYAKSITAIFRRGEKSIKIISNAVDFESSDAETKVRSNVVRTLASRLQQASVTFRKTQKDFLSRRAEQKSAGGGFDFLSELEEQRKQTTVVTSDASSDFTLEQIAVVDDMERQIAQRDKEIANIVASIEELSAIFKELAVLVIDQGTILDRIDYNMEQVVVHVDDGVEALEKAEQYQKSARPRYCICLLLTLIGIMLTLLILKNTDNNNKKN